MQEVGTERILDLLLVDLRRIPRHHAVQLCQIVERIDVLSARTGAIVEHLGHLLFDPQEQTRSQQPFKTTSVGRHASCFQTVALAEAELFHDRRWRIAAVVTGRQAPQHRQDVGGIRQIVVAYDPLRQNGFAVYAHRVHSLGGFVNQGLVVEITDPPQAAEAQGHESNGCVSRNAGCGRNSDGLPVMGYPAGFSDNHLGKKITQEVALALTG